MMNNLTIPNTKHSNLVLSDQKHSFSSYLAFDETKRDFFLHETFFYHSNRKLVEKSLVTVIYNLATNPFFMKPIVQFRFI